MFIYSVRASTVRLVGLVLLLCALVGVVALTGQGDAVFVSGTAVEIDYSGIKTKEKRLAFLDDFGIEVDEGSEEEAEFRMPENLDRVLLGYNELQKKQGLDLLKYRNKKITRYTYKVTNYNAEGEVYANLFIHRGRIIACDLSSAEMGGFVIPLTRVERSNLK